MSPLFLVIAALLFPGPARALTCADATPGLASRMASAECCVRMDAAKRYDCLERTFEADPAPAAELLADLDAARAVSSALDEYCHPVGHAIGRLALRQAGGEMGEALRSCTDSCAFGCQHGILERLLEERGIGGAHTTPDELRRVLPSLCTAEALGSSAMRVTFQCLHGLGHALMFTFDYDLRGALAACDTLGSDYERDSCYSGAFMENLVTPEAAKRDVKAEDPLYPCNALDERYLSRCAQDQTRAFFLRGWTPEQAAEGCRGLGAHAGDCFLGLGRDVSGAYRVNGDETVVRACGALAGEHGKRCVRGALGGLIDMSGDGPLAISYCARLSSPLRESCFSQAGELLRAYHERTEEQVTAYCAAAGEGRADCERLALPAHDPLGQWLLGLLRGLFARFG